MLGAPTVVSSKLPREATLNWEVRIEAGESHPFRGHPVEVGRADAGMAVAAEIAIAEVVGEDDDDVGFFGGGRWTGADTQDNHNCGKD